MSQKNNKTSHISHLRLDALTKHFSPWISTACAHVHVFCTTVKGSVLLFVFCRTATDTALSSSLSSSTNFMATQVSNKTSGPQIVILSPIILDTSSATAQTRLLHLAPIPVQAVTTSNYDIFSSLFRSPVVIL